MRNQQAEPAVLQVIHSMSHKYLELTQDLIVLVLRAALFVAILIKLFHLGQVLLRERIFRRLLPTSYSYWC